MLDGRGISIVNDVVRVMVTVGCRWEGGDRVVLVAGVELVVGVRVEMLVLMLRR